MKELKSSGEHPNWAEAEPDLQVALPISIPTPHILSGNSTVSSVLEGADQIETKV